MKQKVLLILVLLALVVIFFVQNTGEVDFRFIFWKVGMSKVILVPLVLFLGFVIGYLAAILGQRRADTSGQ